jgi:hypothetical protein
VQGQLPRRSFSSPPLLDELLTAAMPGASPPRRLQRLVWAYLALQALLMLAVRVGDGHEAFLEGAVARGWSVLLLLQAFPMALAVARAGGKPHVDEVWTLADLLGVRPEDFAARARLAPLRALVRAFLPALGALLAWPLVLLLGTPADHLALRVLVVALLTLAALLGAAVILALGAAAGRLLPPERAPWALAALLGAPWLISLATDLPVSLPGLLGTLNRWLLALG